METNVYVRWVISSGTAVHYNGKEIQTRISVTKQRTGRHKGAITWKYSCFCFVLCKIAIYDV